MEFPAALRRIPYKSSLRLAKNQVHPLLGQGWRPTAWLALRGAGVFAQPLEMPFSPNPEFS
jgi:hypothetical protein